jgi:hypothetical protein
MAYPTIDGPYGLRPVNLQGGRPYAGAIRHIKIASGYDTDIFYGDVVELVAAGTIERDAATATLAAGAVGVFLGCAYTDATLGFVHSQYWPANQVADDAVAYVCDDPDALYKVAVCSTGTTMASVTRAEALGANIALLDNAGVTATGNSKIAADEGSQNTTATLPLRVVDLVEETKNSSGEYVELIVKLNFGQTLATTGTGLG